MSSPNPTSLGPPPALLPGAVCVCVLCSVTLPCTALYVWPCAYLGHVAAPGTSAYSFSSHQASDGRALDSLLTFPALPGHQEGALSALRRLSAARPSLTGQLLLWFVAPSPPHPHPVPVLVLCQSVFVWVWGPSQPEPLSAVPHLGVVAH